MSAVSGQDGLVHFDSQYAGLFHSGSSLGRRRRGDWLDASYCIDVGWSQSCGGVDQDLSISFTVLRQHCCVCDIEPQCHHTLHKRVSFALLRCWVVGFVLSGVSGS